MPGLVRDPRLALTLALAAAAACTIDNPLFAVTAPGAGSTGDGSDSASTAASTTTGPDTSTPTTTQGPSNGTTTQGPDTTTDVPMGVCGDGVVDPGELCDDGNLEAGDGCDPDCTAPGCGDGVLGGAEECDDGNQLDDDACLGTCVHASCGDGHVQANVEQCDDGNQLDDDACLGDCVVASCGDGQLHAGVEQCDDGNTNDNDGCSAICTPETCGNGIIELPELCDDGNNNDNDNCTSQCEPAKCGDGIVQVGVEQCDDGNADDLDGCKNSCVKNLCGDGVFDIQTEECDGSAGPFGKYAGLCSGVCTLNACAKLFNTEDTNLAGIDWFKPCIEAQGSTVHVIVVDANKQLTYFASGTKNGAWTEEAITGAMPPGDQYKLFEHKPILLGDAKDRLYITSKSSLPLNLLCPSRLGDGYGVTILMPAGDVAKLLFMPNLGKSGKPRNFTNWSGKHELSFNQAGMPLCSEPGPTPALNATVWFAVTP